MKCRSIIFLVGLNATFALCAAPGDVDLTFDPGSRVNHYVYAIAVQPDGKVIIGGEFTTVPGAMRTRIARLHPDGTADNTFDPGAGPDLVVRSVALQPDGKVLVGGYFTNVNGISRGGIARLNTDGSLDGTFDPGSGVGGYDYSIVYAIAVQSDGKVVIGGNFTSVNGVSRPGIARLNPDGTLDHDFDSAPELGSHPQSIVVQSDDKILFAGIYVTTDHFSGRRVIRLNRNGGVDGTFDAGPGPVGSDQYIQSIAIQPDGRLLVAGFFTNFNAVPRDGVARLNTDGSLDPTFVPNLRSNRGFWAVASQADGKALVGGYGTAQVTSVPNREYLVRLNADGSSDSTFDPGPASHSGVFCIAVQDDGKVLAGGDFVNLNGTGWDYLARLNPNGNGDATFNSRAGPNPGVAFVTLQPDGKVLLGGEFTAIDGARRNRLGRLNADGTLDVTFDPGRGAELTYRPYNYAAAVFAVQPDGKLLVGGDFDLFDGVSRNSIVRLHADGNVDTTFNPGSGADRQVSAIVRQTDGKLLVGGVFTSFDGASRNCIVRLNADGSRDAFDPGTFAGGGLFPSVSTIAIQADGGVLVGGSFTSIGGMSRQNLARLHGSGILDTAFNPGANGSVRSIIVQPDSKLLLAGEFTLVAGRARNRVARLNADGTVDGTFNPGSGPNGRVYSAALQPDGKVLLGGDFTLVNGTNRNNVARLNADGSLDLSFNPGSGADHFVFSLAVQPDGNVLAAGAFTSVNSVPRAYVARLLGGEAPSPIPINFHRAMNQLVLSWTNPAFSLQGASSVRGAYTNVPVAASPYTNPFAGGQRYFRLKAN